MEEDAHPQRLGSVDHGLCDAGVLDGVFRKRGMQGGLDEKLLLVHHLPASQPR